MTDATQQAAFLNWVADRFVHVYKEPENVDFVLTLRRLAALRAQPDHIDWKDQYEKQKRRAEMWIAKYEKDIGPLERVYPAAQPDHSELVKRLSTQKEILEMALIDIQLMPIESASIPALTKIARIALAKSEGVL
jgi:hypothetical protein